MTKTLNDMWTVYLALLDGSFLTQWLMIMLTATAFFLAGEGVRRWIRGY